MNKYNTGGPAFPWQENHTHGQNTSQHKGMTLRDYFAAKTLQGMFASGNLPESITDEELSTVAYQTADAMLKARVA